MAITEPDAGSDSAGIRTTAVLDGDEYVMNGEKIFVTAGRALRRGRRLGDPRRVARPRGDQVVRRAQGHAGHDGRAARAQARDQGLRHGDDPCSTTAACPRPTCSVRRTSTPARASRARWQTFDNTRPLVAAMAVGCAKAALDLTRDLLAQAGVDRRLRPPARSSRAQRPRSSCGWRPTGRAPGCSCSRRPGWPTTGRPTRWRRRWPRRRPVASRPTSRCRCVELCGLGRLQRGRAAREVGA